MKTSEKTSAPEVTDAKQRADRIRRGLKSWHELQNAITEAYRVRDWETLGYPTWDAYVIGEFGDLLPQFKSGDKRREIVTSLSEAGMPTRAIASATATSKGTVDRDLKAGAPSGAPGTPDPSSTGIATPGQLVGPAPARTTTTGTDGKTYPRPAPAPRRQTPAPAPPRPITHSGQAAGRTSLRYALEDLVAAAADINRIYFQPRDPGDVVDAPKDKYKDGIPSHVFDNRFPSGPARTHIKRLMVFLKDAGLLDE